MGNQYGKDKGRGSSGKGGSQKRSGSGSSSSGRSGKSGGSGGSRSSGRSSKSGGSGSYGRSGGSGRSRNSSGSSGSSGRSGGSSRRSYDSDDRRSSKSDKKAEWEGHQTKRRRDLQGAAVDLPNWIVEALVRVTPKDRIAPALEALGDASAAMNDGRYHAAVKDAKRAKNLAPQDSTIRETLGLSAYRIGDWDIALAELRAYRRMAGDASHLPIEMDVLRAKGRGKDVKAAWETLQKADVAPAVWKEGKVVYGSYLLDEGDAEGAWELTGPERVGPNAKESDLRVWYIAARASATNGDTDTARKIADAIVLNDPSFPGLDALDLEIARNS
jgi:tetratricopeptide (TPR) repeat protein